MLCEKCAKKPVAKGIKNIICFKCGKKSIVNCNYIQLCDKCSNKTQICQYCGEYQGIKQ